MITETKLRTALDRLAQKRGAKATGQPMSGLSIPAEYYFGRSKVRTASPRSIGRKAR